MVNIIIAVLPYFLLSLTCCAILRMSFGVKEIHFTACSHTFTHFWLTNTSVNDKTSHFLCVLLCAPFIYIILHLLGIKTGNSYQLTSKRSLGRSQVHLKSWIHKRYLDLTKGLINSKINAIAVTECVRSTGRLVLMAIKGLWRREEERSWGSSEINNRSVWRG